MELKKQNLNPKQFLLSLIEESTIHGPPRIVKSKYLLVKLIWLLCFLGSAGYCIYTTWSSICNFLQYDVTTSIQTFRESPATFPVITLCNYNQYQNPNTFDYINKINSNLNGLSNFERDYSIRTQIVSLENSSFKQSLSYNINEMLIACKFNNINCSADEFAWIYHPLYGNCYQFNSGKNRSDDAIEIKKTLKEGNNNGLQLELFLGDPNVSIYFIQKVGLHLMINNQSYKLGNNHGYEIASGVQTSIILKRVLNKKLPQPYNDCIKDIEELKSIDFNIYKAFKSKDKLYRQNDCFDLCFQSLLIKKCDCYSNLIDKINGNQPCMDFNQLFCSISAWNEFLGAKAEECTKTCPIECELMSFQILTSFVEYPSPLYSQELISNTKITSKLGNNSLNYEKIRRLMVGLNIYYEELSYTEISETPKAELVDLVSNIGGLLGLFLGLSFLSFIEIIEAFFTVLFMLIENSNKITLE